MENKILQIPFSLNDETGIVEVCYKENKSALESGFHLLKNLGFDVNMCLGYPTMHAYLKDFKGTGYCSLSAWIQIITGKSYSSLQDKFPSEVNTEADISDIMRELGVPFFAFGYPAEIYDAPCNNLGDFARLQWQADTFLVTHPSRMNDNTISYIIGFSWGYEEWNEEGVRKVKMYPIQISDCSVWNGHLETLRDGFPKWKFK